jgi:hypothetical protein
MPLDRRLRDGVDRLTSQVDPDVDRSLDRTFRRARRTIALRRAGAASVVAASVALAIVIGPRTIDALRNERAPSPATKPSNTNPAAIAGTYQIVIPNDEPAVRQNHLAGRWTIGLGTDGIMTVSTPPSYAGPRSGYRFRISGEEFRTDLFSTGVCSGIPPGVYRWALSGATLTLTPIDEQCTARATLLGSQTWGSVQP